MISTRRLESPRPRREGGYDGYAADHRIADSNVKDGIGGDEDIHARAELHHAIALTGFHVQAFPRPADDPAREDPDDLPNDDRLTRVIDGDLRALIQIARFLLVCGQKPTRMILHPYDAATDRYPIDVHVHRRQEHTHLLPVSRRRRLARGLARDHDPPVGRRQHRARRSVMDAVGVAKKNSRKLETTNRGTPSTAPISSQTKAVITAAPRMKGQPAGSIRNLDGPESDFA